MRTSAVSLNEQTAQYLARQISAAEAYRDRGVPLPSELFEASDVREAGRLGLDEYIAGLKRTEQSIRTEQQW